MSPQIEFEKTVIDRLARIETILENHVEAYAKNHQDHETRLRKIEMECWLNRGAHLLFAAVLGWLGVHVNLH